MVFGLTSRTYTHKGSGSSWLAQTLQDRLRTKRQIQSVVLCVWKLRPRETETLPQSHTASRGSHTGLTQSARVLLLPKHPSSPGQATGPRVYSQDQLLPSLFGTASSGQSEACMWSLLGETPRTFPNGASCCGQTGQKLADPVPTHTPQHKATLSPFHRLNHPSQQGSGVLKLGVSRSWRQPLALSW